LYADDSVLVKPHWRFRGGRGGREEMEQDFVHVQPLQIKAGNACTFRRYGDFSLVHQYLTLGLVQPYKTYGGWQLCTDSSLGLPDNSRHVTMILQQFFGARVDL